jgi:predicted Rossmann-fold nucleotide-binding protein
MPGGYGTMDEIFETMTLVQTGKIRDFPVVLMGLDYWKEMFEFLEVMVDRGTIHREDLARLHRTDDPAQAASILTDAATTKFGLSYEAPKPHWYLLERGFPRRRPRP